MHTKDKVAFFAAVASVVALSAVLPSQSIAFDYSYTGATCVVDRWSPTTLTGTWTGGAVSNRSSSADLYLTCGLPRSTNVIGGSGVGGSSDYLLVTSWVHDRSGAESIRSRAQACYSNFSSCVYSSFDYSSTGSDTLNHTLYMGTREATGLYVEIPDNDTTNDANGSFLLSIDVTDWT